VVLLLALLACGCTPVQRPPAHDGSLDAAGDGPHGATDGGADAPDLGLTEAGSPILLITINNEDASGVGYYTTAPGTALSFAALFSCPSSCSYAWDFGNGKTPAAFSYSQEGLYHVTLTVTDSQDKQLGQAKLVVTAWDGKATDDFERTQMDLDQHLWLAPLDPKAAYAI